MSLASIPFTYCRPEVPQDSCLHCVLEYSDEEFDDEEEEDPFHTKMVREALVRKYGKLSPEGSEEEEELGEEVEEEEEDEDDVEDEDEDPEQEYDVRIMNKLKKNQKKRYLQITSLWFLFL